MDLDTPTLKEARLGPIILFYTKTKRVQPSINRQADALIQAWSRPIIKRPSNFRSRYVGGDASQSQNQGQNQNSNSQGGASGGAPGEAGSHVRRGGEVSQSQIKRQRFDYRKALKENEGRRQARVQVAQVGVAATTRKETTSSVTPLVVNNSLSFACLVVVSYRCSSPCKMAYKLASTARRVE
jgi:transcription factor SPN1